MIFIYNTKNNKECSQECMNCQDSATKCISCNPGYFLTADKKCLVTCPNGTYPSDQNKCEVCPDGCSNCFTKDLCTQCTDPKQILQQTLTDSKTYTFVCSSLSTQTDSFQTTDQFFTDKIQSLDVLQKCDQECLTCIKGSYQCTSCAVGYLPSSNDATFTCVKSCEDGKYYDGVKCSQCSNNCVSCNNGSDCSICSSITYKQKKLDGKYECVIDCKEGYYADQVDLACYECHSNCKTCFGPTEFNCIDCKAKKSGNDDIIAKVGKYHCKVTKCGDGFLSLDYEECDDGNNVNLDGCNSDCKVENGWYCCIPSSADSKLWSCNPQINANIPYDNSIVNMVYYKSKCFTKCGDGVRVGPEFGGTESCDTAGEAGCDENCQLQRGYVCSGGTPQTKDICTYKCSENCKKCQVNYENHLPISGSCIECESGFYAYEEKCYKECPKNLYQDKTSGFGYCVLICPAETLIDGFNCVMQCSPGQARLNNRCFDNCEEGTFESINPDTKQKECQACHFSCKTCNGPNQTNCKQCTDGYRKIKLEGDSLQCVLQCKNGYKLDKNDQTLCQVCLENCDSCLPQYYQYNDDCVTDCPDGTIKNTQTRFCDKFENPVVEFIYQPLIPKDTIGINQDQYITAKIQSVYPITSMIWSIENQSPQFLSDQKLNTKTIFLSKKNLSYNMKITLKFIVESSKGITIEFINLQTQTRPAIQIKFNSHTINHLSDVFSITSTNWPKSEIFNYQIICIGTQTNTQLQIDSGQSSDNLNVKYIFPFLNVGEDYKTNITLWNEKNEVSIPDSIRVEVPVIETKTMDQIFRGFDLNNLKIQVIDTMIQTVDNKYADKLKNNLDMLSNSIKNIYYKEKFGIPDKCRNKQCSDTSTCVDSSGKIECKCSAGYTGKYCSFKTDEFSQIRSLGTVINNSITKNKLDESDYLSVGIRLTGQTDVGDEIFYSIGNQMKDYIDKLDQKTIEKNYNKYFVLIGQILDEQVVLSEQTSTQTTFFISQIMNFQNLNKKRMEILNQDIPYVSMQYSNSLQTFLNVINTTDIKSLIKFAVSSKWELSNQTQETSGSSRNRRLQVIDDDKKVYNLTDVIQTDIIEAEVEIPLKVIESTKNQNLQFQMHKWQQNPRKSYVSNSTLYDELLTDLETDYIEIQTNIDEKYLVKSDNSSHVLFKLPRIRKQMDFNIDQEETPYTCYSFDVSSKAWTNSTCIFQEETSYYIYCDCWTINTVLFAKRNFEIFDDQNGNNLRKFIEKLVTDSGLWMTIGIFLMFGLCWLGTKDSNDPEYIDKRSFRRLTPILSIFFVRYPMKPVRFRILSVAITIFTQLLIESVFYFALDNDINHSISPDAIPSYALLGIFLTIPVSYAVGKFSKWAQYSESEEKIIIEIQYEKQQPSHHQYTYHIVSNQKEGESIKKQYIQRQQTLQKQLSYNTKIQKYKKLRKFKTINHSDQLSQDMNNQIQSSQIHDEQSQTLPQPKILIMEQDLIKKRVVIFMFFMILLGLVEAVLTIVFIGLNEHNDTTSYFAGSAILGMILDFLIFDFGVSLAAKYLKFVFKILKHRGIWFKMPKDIKLKKEDIQLISDLHSEEKSSYSSKVNSNAFIPEKQIYENEYNKENIENKNINNFIEKNNYNDEEDLNPNLDHLNNNESEEKSSESNHNF